MTSRCGWRRCCGDTSTFLAFGMAPFWLVMTGFRVGLHGRAAPVGFQAGPKGVDLTPSARAQRPRDPRRGLLRCFSTRLGHLAILN
jgi:hypothetical protein